MTSVAKNLSQTDSNANRNTVAPVHNLYVMKIADDYSSVCCLDIGPITETFAITGVVSLWSDFRNFLFSIEADRRLEETINICQKA